MTKKQNHVKGKITIEYKYVGKAFVMSDGSQWNPKPGWHKWKSYDSMKSAGMALDTLNRNFKIYEFRIKPDDTSISPKDS